MTDSGTVTAAGTGAFTTSAANADITLDTLAVTGAITPTTSGAGADVTIANATGVDMNGWTIGGNLPVSAAAGNITDSNTVTVGGTASFISAGTNDDITVNQLAVTGTIAANTTGATGNATI